jgi:hypothetical protein
LGSFFGSLCIKRVTNFWLFFWHRFIRVAMVLVEVMRSVRLHFFVGYAAPFTASSTAFQFAIERSAMVGFAIVSDPRQLVSEKGI